MSSLGEPIPVSMALAADASVGEMSLFAKEWLSQSSASSHQHQQQLLLPLSPLKKYSSKSDGGIVSREKAKEVFLFSPKTSAHDGSVEHEKGNEGLLSSGENLPCESFVEPVFQVHNVPIVNGKQKEKEKDGIPPLVSTLSPMIKSRCSKSSSNLSRMANGIPPHTSTSSPIVKPKCSKSSSIQGREEDEIPPLTSTSSPLIKSKSSKSSSNQGRLPGLVVAPDGVTMVKDRRKCKPRGILTVGVETSSSAEGNVGEEAALPTPSPSVATVEWVHESWENMLSPQSHTDELSLSSSVNIKDVIGPPVALTFDFTPDSKSELGEKEASGNSREAVDTPSKIAPSVQESYEVGESVEGSPGELIVADSDVYFRPELGDEGLDAGREDSVPTSSNKQQHRVESIQVISPQKQLMFSDLDSHQLEAQSLDIRQSLRGEPQADVSCSTGRQIGEGPSDYSSGVIPFEHSESIHLTAEKDEVSEGVYGNSSGRNPHENSESILLALEKDESHVGNPETESEVIETFRPLLSVCSSLVQPPEEEGSGAADVLLCNLTDLAYARDVHIIAHTHDEGLEVHRPELSQRMHHAENQVLVAETLYQLAAENLRKTRTAARRFNSAGEKRSHMEAVAPVLSIVTLPTSRIDTSTSGEHSSLTEAVPYALSPRVSRQMTSRPELAKMDLAQPLRRIILTYDSDFSPEVKTVNALIRNVQLDSEDDEVSPLQPAIRGADDEAQGTESTSLAGIREAQPQCSQVSGHNNSITSFGKAQQHRRRFSSGCKCVRLGTFLATAAAFGFVAISLAMGSCHLCSKSDQYHHYLQPT